MRKIFNLLLLTSLLCGCEKLDLGDLKNDSTTLEKTTGEGEFVVSLNSSVDNTETYYSVPAKTRASVGGTGMGDYITRLSYHITDISGTKIKTESQWYEDDDFGSISVRLDKGTYVITVVAYSGSGNCSFSDATSTFGKISFKDNKVTDTFLKCDTVIVNSDVSLDMCLTRCSSEIILRSSGKHPGNISYLYCELTGGSNTLSGPYRYGYTKSSPQKATLDVEDSEEYKVYTFPYKSNTADISMSVHLQDSGNNDIDEITFTKTIPIKAGCVTVATCSLYDRNTASGGISIDTQWGDTIYVNL